MQAGAELFLFSNVDRLTEELKVQLDDIVKLEVRRYTQLLNAESTNPDKLVAQAHLIQVAKQRAHRFTQELPTRECGEYRPLGAIPSPLT